MQWNISLDTQEHPDFGKRVNPNEQYEVPDMKLNPREQVLLKALHKAVANGWQGWRSFVNDAVTLGMEPEGVLRDMRRSQAPIEPLIFNLDFAKALWGQNWWDEKISEMATQEDRIKYLSDNV